MLDKRRNTPGLVAIAVFIGFACWLFWAYTLRQGDFVSAPVAEALSSFLGLRYSSLPTAIVGVATAILGVWLTRRYLLLDIRGQGVFFLLAVLFLSTNPYLMIWEYSTPVLLLLALSFVPLFNSYHHPQAAVPMFDCGLALGLASILWGPSLYIVPLFLFHCHTLQVLSIRNILTLLLGILVPLWVLCPVLYFFGYGSYLLEQVDLLCRPAFYLLTINSYDYTVLIGRLILPAVLLLLCIIASVHLSFSYWKEKVYSRTLCYILAHTGFYLLAVSLFAANESGGFQYLSILPISILLARSLTALKQKPFVLSLSFLVLFFVGAFFLSVYL